MTGGRKIAIRGDVVERPRKPWTPTVQSLLADLGAQGLPIPTPLGYDDRLEYVRLIPGDAGDAAWQHQVELAGVRSAGGLLRRIHDATVAWQPPADARWSVPFTPGDVICHGDPQPANFAWSDGRAVGLFDWDAARPGSRLDDLAYALLWFVPINATPEEMRRRGLPGAVDRRARADALLEGYGWSDPVDVVEIAVARHARAIDEVEWLGRQGHQPHATWLADGWPDRWRADLDRMRTDNRTLSAGANGPADRTGSL